MACAPRDILIEQVQTAPTNTFTPATNARPAFDVRFGHAVKCLFFGVRNRTNKAEWSNWTAGSPVSTATGVNFAPAWAVDPIQDLTLIYEATSRLYNMGSDYFSLIQPYYHAVSIPTETGMHMYAYALDICNLDPTGSTNFGRLTNVSMVMNASAAALLAGDPAVADRDSGAVSQQTYEFVCVAVNHNVVRVSGGALGFPIL
jgi:hypothetical protein